MDEHGTCNDLFHQSHLKLGGNGLFTTKTHKDVLEPLTVAELTPSMVPRTPGSTWENNPISVEAPLTSVKKLPKILCFDSENVQSVYPSFTDSGSPKTPNHDVFTPFALGPDDTDLPPLCKKCYDESQSSVSRCLTFDPSKKLHNGSRGNNDAEKEMLESVYENLLEVIFTKQLEGALQKFLMLDLDFDVLGTPPSRHRLSVIAESCPGAPVKATRKWRNFSVGLCRKLEF